MEKEFIPYAEALALKELGFNEPCFKTFNYDYDEEGIPMFQANLPLYQQAFRWFREKYSYVSFVREATKCNYRFCIEKFDEKFYNSTILTYEEAELECLKKLIEIVKNK